MSKSPQHQDIYNQLAAKDTNPEPLKKVIAREQAREQADYDCLSCRVMGGYTFSATASFHVADRVVQEQQHLAL